MNGWKLTGLATLLLIAAFGSIVSAYGTDEHGLRVLVRATARISFLVFLPVYVASSVRRLWPNDFTRWLLRNRRHLGVSFFVAHMLHLDAILMLSVLLGDAFVWEPVSVVFGGLAYVLVTAMALTSSKRAVAWLGPKRWARLHRFGIHYVAFIWLFQWLGLAFASPGYALLLALLLAAFGVRLAAWRARGAGAPTAPAVAAS